MIVSGRKTGLAWKNVSSGKTSWEMLSDRLGLYPTWQAASAALGLTEVCGVSEEEACENLRCCHLT